ncbi:Squalene/phytoene synthase-domain-containing protein [Stachybotrys elegans]|uniref:Small ribosomal subunit protein bS6m n=1 Tax=Stachybotrys elegans TaxID=80388 RepID=A0A8K0SH13_9HYPO|nr:Squalene/phytoene synthase-domain-containing protein [Stachybotrys elegans]
MHRPRVLSNGLRTFVRAKGRTYVTDADVESARRYCFTQLQSSDYDAHLIRRFVPPPVQDTYAALRTLNLELVRLPELVSNPTIGAMRMKFWQESIDNTFAGRPPREPICILLHKAIQELEQRGGGGDKTSVKFWISRLIRTREKFMDNRPFTSLAALEDYAEHTYSTLMYATLAAMPLKSMHVDHLASHIGKACGIAAVLRGIPILAAPPQPVKTPSGVEAPVTREPTLLLPLDVMAEEGVKEEEVFRQGPNAPGLQDAVFKVATRANDHLITAREMLKKLQAGEGPGHDFEHEGEDHHVYPEESDTARDIRRGFGVLLEAVPAAHYLENLEKANFDPFAHYVVAMLYELIAIVRPGSLAEVKEIASTVGTLVLRGGGVVRGINNWGIFSLPRPLSVHQVKQTQGHYFVMRYDASTKIHDEIRSTLKLEPRMIRSAHVKLGDGKLETVARIGAPKWNGSVGEV